MTGRFSLSLLAVMGGFVSGAGILPPEAHPAGGQIRSPSLVRLTNPNSAGAIFYTLDGSDPLDHFGNVVPHARSYSDPISVNRTLILRARAKHGSDWSELMAAAFTADQDFSKLLFTEVMFHPVSSQSPVNWEFVELKNTGNLALDLSGLELATSVPTNSLVPATLIPQGTVVEPGEFFLLVENPDHFRLVHPNVPFDGIFAQKLSNEAGRLWLRSVEEGAVASHMAWDTHAPWQVVPDNHGYFLTLQPPGQEIGFSLVRANLNPVSDPEDHRTWRASAFRGGAPGAEDPDPGIPPIHITELLSRTSGELRDSVELFNPGPTNVMIGGWWLSDERNMPYRYRIPPGTTVPAGGFLVLDESLFNAGDKGFLFSADGDRCYLFSGDPSGVLTGYSDGLEFEASDRNVTFGRYVTSDGLIHFPPQIARTMGGANAGPEVGPVVINELYYHPSSTNEVEWVELKNITSLPVSLSDPNDPSVPWSFESQIRPGQTGMMPINQILPAGGYLLLVAGTDLARFRVEFGVPAEVPILPLLQPLDNSGETLLLFKPSGQNGDGGIRSVVADELTYTDQFPWPVAPDGGGHSLERIDPSGFSNEPGNWRASPDRGSPGRDNSTHRPPQVWAGGESTHSVNRPAWLAGAVTDEAGWKVEWAQMSGPAAATLASASIAGIRATFPTPGTYVLRLSASDGISVRSDEAVIHVRPSWFEAWRHDHFTPTEIADLGTSGAEADPDADGASNLKECLLSTSPQKADTVPGFRTQVSQGRLQVSWTQNAGAWDLGVELERADQLSGPWFGGPGLFQRTETLLANGMVDVAVQDLLPLTDLTKRFVRIRLFLRD